MRLVPSEAARRVRCAIYTRKSSDEGLEQAFNSLDAQREACAAYVLSQASEGWSALPDIYDDGGLSGGTLERPALQRLLAEVDAGRIDIIVVYKVDRLTRSLFDFAKLVERLEAGGASFVSVTQSFNTTTSMGRLTLNMLSFAQFEREVTAERIRDKIAASKAKGMWMGGNPPVGYTPDGRTLRIVEDEAVQVRSIFQRYLRLGNVRYVTEELIRDGVTTPRRVNGKGKAYGGCAWSRGQIYRLLSNPVYIGLIEHKGGRYQGLHTSIIDAETWEQAHARLAENLQGRRNGAFVREPSLLAGKVEDANGNVLTCEHASKIGPNEGAERIRYRYYVAKRGGGASLRVPARELEAIVVEQIAALMNDPLRLASAAALTLDADTLWRLREGAGVSGTMVRDRSFTDRLIHRVRVSPGAVEIICYVHTLAELLSVRQTSTDATVVLKAPVRTTRTGRVMKMADTNNAPLIPAIDMPLLRLIAKAHRWWAELRKGELNVSELSARDGVKPSYMTRVLRLAFVSPEVTASLLRGWQSVFATVGELTLGLGVPICWDEQARRLIVTRRSLNDGLR